MKLSNCHLILLSDGDCGVRRRERGDADGRWNFTKTAGAGSRAAVREGPVGQSRRPPNRLPQHGDDRRCALPRANGQIRAATIKSTAGIAAVMKAVTSALAGAMITPGEAATIAAELAMPDLDQIKQGEQGGAGPVRQGPVGQSRRPAARLVVDTFVRAIETSDFDRRLRQVEAGVTTEPVDAATYRGYCAADSLHMARRAIIDTIYDCGSQQSQDLTEVVSSPRAVALAAPPASAGGVWVAAT